MLEWLVANALSLVTAAVAGLTLLLVMKNDIRILSDAMGRQEHALTDVAKKIEEHQKDDIDQFAMMRREVGETFAALRTKVQEVELFSRDTFMRRDSAGKMQDALQSDFRSLGEKIDNRLERMEAKFDR